MPENEEERNSARASLIREAGLYEDVINAIKDAIGSGISTKTELIEEVRDTTSRPKTLVKAVLTQFTGPAVTGHLWTVVRGAHNTHSYPLNEGGVRKLVN